MLNTVAEVFLFRVCEFNTLYVGLQPGYWLALPSSQHFYYTRGEEIDGPKRGGMVIIFLMCFTLELNARWLPTLWQDTL